MKTWNGQSEASSDIKQLIENKTNNPIYILMRIVSDEPDAKFPILESLAIDLLIYIRYHLQNRNTNESFKKKIKDFLEEI